MAGLAGMSIEDFTGGANLMNYGDPGFGGQAYTPNMVNVPRGGFTGAMKNFNLGAQGVLGLAGAYNAYKQRGLMEDQFNFSKSLANRNLANTAATTNRMLRDRATMAGQMLSGADYGTPEQKAASEKVLTQVSGAPI